MEASVLFLGQIFMVLLNAYYRNYVKLLPNIHRRHQLVKISDSVLQGQILSHFK